MTNFVNKRTQLRPRYSMREKIFVRLLKILNSSISEKKNKCV